MSFRLVFFLYPLCFAAAWRPSLLQEKGRASSVDLSDAAAAAGGKKRVTAATNVKVDHDHGSQLSHAATLSERVHIQEKEGNNMSWFVGQRVDALHDGAWYPGEIMSLPTDGRTFVVQADVDEKGVLTHTQAIRAASDAAVTTASLEWDVEPCAEWHEDTCVSVWSGWTCDAMASLTIKNVETWCGKLGMPVFTAYHCVAVARLNPTYMGGNETIVMMELEGSEENLAESAPKKGGQQRAHIRCVPLDWSMGKNKAKSVEDQSMIAMTHVSRENPPKPPRVAGNVKNLHDLRRWAEEYAQEYPAYSLMTTNCQHFSTGLYNGVTGSEVREKQWYSQALSKRPWNWLKGRFSSRTI